MVSIFNTLIYNFNLYNPLIIHTKYITTIFFELVIDVYQIAKILINTSFIASKSDIPGYQNYESSE